jgi:mesencephalic astrocyte-derived neurotrophic factor
MLVTLLSLVLIVLVVAIAHAKKPPKVDPKECEVCIANLEAIDLLLPDKSDKRDKGKIEAAINKHCTKSGFGSEWKPASTLKSPKDVKMCYYFEPIKKSISMPFSMGMPKLKVCKKLMKDNPEVCDVRYPIKVEKKDGEKVDYGKMRVKELRKLLEQRGEKCVGCTEKPEFVKMCEETEHLDL